MDTIWPEGCLPLEEYARQAKRTLRTMQRWREQGVLVTRKIGNIVLVDVPATNKRIVSGVRSRGKRAAERRVR